MTKVVKKFRERVVPILNIDFGFAVGGGDIETATNHMSGWRNVADSLDWFTRGPGNLNSP